MVRCLSRLLPAAAVVATTSGVLGQVQPPSRPPSSLHFVEYGVAVAAESPLDAGDVCPEGATAPCVLGPGVGVVLRAGYRARGPWYLGGAYEASRHESSNILRLAILQQLRGEVRRYWAEGRRVTPFILGGFGAATYGNEWGVNTAGPLASLGVGGSLQASAIASVSLGLSWRCLLLRAWTDGADQRRADTFLGFGLAHILGLELSMEVRDPLPRW